MHLCILEADTNSDPGLIDHGSMPEQFKTWLEPALPEARWSSVAVHAGESLPDPRDYDAYLITGSRYGVYDDLHWIEPLASFVGSLGLYDIPVGGICFGHQIIAKAHGARVEKSENGWVLGAESYDGQTAFAMHQDQVLSMPDGAGTIVSSDRCPVARIEYAFPALSVQYHPEFTADFMETLLDMYADQIDKDRVASARRSLQADLHTDTIAAQFAEFFRKHTQ